METSTLLFAILILCLVGVTSHAWRLSNEKRDVPCLLPVPGVGTVLGLGMAALTVAMWRGHCAPRLPQRVAELELPRHWAKRVLVGLASAYAPAVRHARARLSYLAIPGRQAATALAVGLMAAINVMPIPLGSLLPAVALVFIGLGLVFRDGVAVILGLLMSGLALVATTGLLLMALVWGTEWILGLGLRLNGTD